jgi:Transglutaminase-like superfamily
LRVAVGGSHLRGLIGYRENLSGGDHGTIQTIRVMRQLIDQAQADQQFNRFAVDLVRDLPAHDEASEVARIYEFVHSHIRYTKDPVSKEKLYPPMELLKIGAGDCDDTSMLICALALTLGYPARLITVSANGDSPNEFSHVYPEVEVPAGSGNWLAMDVARPGAQLGLSPEVFFRKRAWSLTDNGYTDLQGSRGLAGYTRLGQIDSTSILSQALAETPQIMAVAEGNPTASTYGSTGSPGTYFVGAGGNMLTTPTSLQAGYGLQTANPTLSSLLPLLLLAGVVLLVAR